VDGRPPLAVKKESDCSNDCQRCELIEQTGTRTDWRRCEGESGEDGESSSRGTSRNAARSAPGETRDVLRSLVASSASFMVGREEGS
jgi:hypothetical protein